ncbi:MAG: ERF family protein [Methanobrevibacter sp.]|nr:ERF family protein [Methanobrevibacter sp.]
MSIYKRHAKINCELLGKKIQKTGYNKHKKFYYYELEDMIPPVYAECFKENIDVDFPFCEGVAILKLVDMDNPKEYLTYRIGMPEIIAGTKNTNNQVIQDVGADITYLKRYLLKLAFPCFMDKDVIDMGIDDDSSAKNTNESSAKKEEKKVADLPMGNLVLKARDNLVKKGVDEKDITYKLLKQTVLHMQKWTVPERRCILNYFKEKEGAK